MAVGRAEPGRGAWLCRGSLTCLERAIARRALARALRGEVPDETFGELRRVIGSENGHECEGSHAVCEDKWSK